MTAIVSETWTIKVLPLWQMRVMRSRSNATRAPKVSMIAFYAKKGIAAPPVGNPPFHVSCANERLVNSNHSCQCRVSSLKFSH